MATWKQVWVTFGLALVAAGGARAEGPTLHLNTKRYADRSPSAATGRSGNASLTARALLSKTSGQTVLDVTTGALDAPASSAPGNISHLQIKGFGENGELRWVVNDTGLNGGGAVQRQYQEMFRGQPFQVQGNIRGIDGNRTDVVTISGNVRYRPDLKVVSIAAPETARVGLAVNISATISEIAGDTGATASCLLYAGGSTTPVDRADGIWVDGDDTVSCAFTHTFEVAGTQTIRVEVAAVTPADDVLSNNEATATIEVLSASEPLQWHAAVSGQSVTTHNRSDGYFQYSSGTWSTGSDWSYVTDAVLKDDYSFFIATSTSRVRFPLASVAVTHSTPTTTLASVSRTNVPASWSYGNSSCGGAGTVLYSSNWAMHMYVDEWHCNSTQYTSIFSMRYAGKVTYFGSNYFRYWYRDGSTSYEYSYSYNYNFSYGNNAPSSQGAGVSMPFSITDADGQLFEATPAVTPTVTSVNASAPYSCWEYSSTPYYGYSYRFCNEYSITGTRWYGFSQGSTN